MLINACETYMRATVCIQGKGKRLTFPAMSRTSNFSETLKTGLTPTEITSAAPSSRAAAMQASVLASCVHSLVGLQDICPAILLLVACSASDLVPHEMNAMHQR
jgi:hypothetical protein